MSAPKAQPNTKAEEFGTAAQASTPSFVTLGDTGAGGSSGIGGMFRYMAAGVIVGGALLLLGRTRWGYTAMYDTEVLILLMLIGSHGEQLATLLQPLLASTPTGPSGELGSTAQ